jgi:hypothetical protein
LHETAHLLAPSRDHGTRFRRCLMRLWSPEFNIEPGLAHALAAEHGVEL